MKIIELSVRYVINIIGKTISFAGEPNIKPSRITPSNPINLPTGSKNDAIYDKSEILLTFKLVSNHIANPAGAATFIALNKTVSVLSLVAMIKVLIISGFLYGGNSNIYGVAFPL